MTTEVSTPALFDDTAPTDFAWASLMDWRSDEDIAFDQAVHGDFPTGPALVWNVRQGKGLALAEEADLRARSWDLLRDQAVVYALAVGQATYASAGSALGITPAAVHKRYASLVAEVVAEQQGAADA
jgi:hypothetical protein